MLVYHLRQFGEPGTDCGLCDQREERGQCRLQTQSQQRASNPAVPRPAARDVACALGEIGPLHAEKRVDCEDPRTGGRRRCKVGIASSHFASYFRFALPRLTSPRLSTNAYADGLPSPCQSASTSLRMAISQCWLGT